MMPGAMYEMERFERGGEPGPRIGEAPGEESDVIVNIYGEAGWDTNNPIYDAYWKKWETFDDPETAACPELAFRASGDVTVYVGNLPAAADEGSIAKLFQTCGPIVSVNMPRDKKTGKHQGFAFVAYTTRENAVLAQESMNMARLFDKQLRVRLSFGNELQPERAGVIGQGQDVGANLHVSNLEPEVNEKVLHEMFSTFGALREVRIMRDPKDDDKGFAIVSYDNFQSSDAALDAMNGQYIGNRAIKLSYANRQAQDGSYGSPSLLAAPKPGTLPASHWNGRVFAFALFMFALISLRKLRSFWNVTGLHEALIHK